MILSLAIPGILVFLLGIVMLALKIRSRGRLIAKQTLSSTPATSSLEEAISKREALIRALGEASLGYANPKKIALLERKVAAIKSEKTPVEEPVSELETQLLDVEIESLERVCKLEVEKPIDDSNYQDELSDYFRVLSPKACSELRNHADLLQELDKRIETLSGALAKAKS